MTRQKHSLSLATTKSSHRLQRVGEQIRRGLAEILHREFPQDELLRNTSITVSEVRMSVDLRHAFVFVTPLGGQDLRSIVRHLRERAPFLRTALKKHVYLKFLPQLHFEADISFQQGQHIEQLIDRLKMQYATDTPSQED